MSDKHVTYSEPPKPEPIEYSGAHRKDADRFLAFVPETIPKNSWQVGFFCCEVYLRNLRKTVEVRYTFQHNQYAQRVYELIGSELSNRIV